MLRFVSCEPNIANALFVLLPSNDMGIFRMISYKERIRVISA
jgi:hypothetical protein